LGRPDFILTSIRPFVGYGQMETGQGKAKSFPPSVKAPAKVRVAMRTGCPF